MPDPLPDGIVTRITKLIESKTQSKEEGDLALKSAAHEAWIILFPKDPDPTAKRAPPGTRMRRWDALLEQLSANPHRDKIIRVIDSAASGERFDWLDSRNQDALNDPLGLTA